MMYLGTVDLLRLVVALNKTRLPSTFFLWLLRQLTQRAKFYKVNQRISYLFYFLEGV